MSLALRMGRTLHELCKTLTASELKMWIAFDNASPIGDWRGDVQAAQVSTAVLNAQGAKASINEMILKWGQTEEESEISGLEEWMGGL
ncbi:phage tail assembly protein T [Candidatus Pantoea formicae]|uniref:phage tail assembly protein T n=1 Tax=Candidatus Pantoea formicae TaxID=2608355 RepID=UPI003EDAFBF7